jgi:uncharacterized protein (DUF2461 family)
MMIQAQTLQFLSKLKENNNKPWFDTNRKTYEIAKKNFAEIVHLAKNLLYNMSRSLFPDFLEYL